LHSRRTNNTVWSQEAQKTPRTEAAGTPILFNNTCDTHKTLKELNTNDFGGADVPGFADDGIPE